VLSLSGKRAIIFGVASEDSIAWAIAQRLAEQGVKVTLGYQKRFLSRVLQLVKEKPWIEAYRECDVSIDDSVKTFFDQAEGKYDILVHAVAFAPAEALSKSILYTTEQDFNTAMVVSSYSLVRVTRHAMRVLNPGSSVITLTYLGSTRVIPGYRVMGTAKAALEEITRELAAALGPAGHRVNAISAGPIKTLAASGVPGFDQVLGWMQHTTPLKRTVTQGDVANCAAFLASPESSAITGQIIYVDAGYNIVGIPPDLDQIMKK
jgi:enoyl-[acyl-carrier protein] reductase I